MKTDVFLNFGLMALDHRLMKVNMVLEADFLKVLMNLDYAIGLYMGIYATRFYIRIRSTRFQKNIKSNARVQSSRKRVCYSTTHGCESRMNVSCKGFPVRVSHYVASDRVLLM